MIPLTHSQTATKGKGNTMYKLELTAKQLEAMYYAITIHRGSYDGWTDEELKELDIKRELLALRQVEAKLDKATAKAGN